MIYPRKKINIILFSVMCFIILFSGVISAQEITFEEAVKIALIENHSIQELEKNVESIKRELRNIEAQADWQIKLGANYRHNFGEESTTEFQRENNSVDLTLNKNFFSGLSLTPQINFSEDFPNNSEYKLNADINISYPLYPQEPSALEKNFYKAQKNLLKAEKRLAGEKNELLISWIEDYLNLSRMIERNKIYREGIERAEKNLEKVLKQKKIGEAGKQQLLTAELSLENAKYSYQEHINRIENARYSLYRELGLDEEEHELIFNQDSVYLNGLRRNTTELVENYMEQEDLIDTAVQNSYELTINLIDREIIEQELEWKSKGKSPVLMLSGDYNTRNEDLTLALNLSYDIYDGGQFKLSLEAVEEELDSNISEYNQRYEALKQYLKQHRDQFELNQTLLKKEELSLKRNQYTAEIAEKQFEMGSIDYLEYQEEWIAGKEAEVNFKSIKDQIFIDRMKFISFVEGSLLIWEVEG